MDFSSGSNQFDEVGVGMADAPSGGKAHGAIGSVFEIAGSNSQILLDRDAIGRLGADPDPAIAMSGQVGSQVKIKIGSVWLVASVRSMRTDMASGAIVAQIDFLGEGDEERLTGRLYNFRRGVTRYPVPGAQVHPVSSLDMKEMFSADERPHVEVGTVFPTRDIRGALFVDALLGKHFALLGSTGTGKSTSAALIHWVPGVEGTVHGFGLPSRPPVTRSKGAMRSVLYGSPRIEEPSQNCTPVSDGWVTNT